MARIAGINIPMNKHVWVGLTHIYGVGRTRALNACEGARTTRSDPFAGVAQQLVRQASPP